MCYSELKLTPYLSLYGDSLCFVGGVNRNIFSYRSYLRIKNKASDIFSQKYLDPKLKVFWYFLGQYLIQQLEWPTLRLRFEPNSYWNDPTIAHVKVEVPSFRSMLSARGGSAWTLWFDYCKLLRNLRHILGISDWSCDSARWYTRPLQDRCL